MPLGITIVLILIALGLGGVVGYWLHSKSVEHDLSSLAEHRRLCLRRSGSTVLVPGCEQFTIESYDGGLTWYAVSDETIAVRKLPNGRYTRDFKLTILGLAEKVYPGLLEHLNLLDRITEHARKQGPVATNSALAAELLGNLKQGQPGEKSARPPE